MRLASLSFLTQALLLTAVAAQSVGSVDLIKDITSESSSAAAEPSSSAEAITTTTTTTSEQATSTAPTTSDVPTTTTTSQEQTIAPSTSSSSSSSDAADPTTSETSVTSKSNEASQTTSVADSVTSSDSPTTTRTPVVTVITSIATISGTTVPTVMTSTSIPTETSSPSLNADGKGSDSGSGVSESNKKIIIGVVVGVGGAIVLGVLGIVIWRIQKKRNGQYNEEDDDLMGGTAVGTNPREKAPSPAAAGTPFKSTLDQYHNPGPVNAASNF